MRFYCFLCILLAACLTFPACDLFWGNGGSSGELPFRNIEKAEYLSAVEPGTLVFNDAATWETFWRENTAWADTPGRDSLRRAPAVDFENRTVAGLFWSAQSGCYSLVEAVERVERAGPQAARVVVGALPDLGDCEAIVHPVQVITFEKSQRVTFSGVLPQ